MSLDESVPEQDRRVLFKREIVTENYIVQHVNIIELLGEYELKEI